ncbi:MAG TPA: glycosyltransferase family 39 protein [Solirubrobacteraceae bacterium]|nr:glycosyltransferase family 39 protein [Solirubrobacteraceae bacterium]
MTAVWRRRRSRATGQSEKDPRQPTGGGWRAWLGVSPYHRNPIHVLLANPGVIAALVLALALMLRVLEVQGPAYTPAHNARAYLTLGGQIANSGDYASQQVGAGGTRVGPTAYYAPGYPYLLGALNAISGHVATSASQIHVDRLAQAVLGTVVVGIIGLIALELFGVDMALLAMALAAIYPPMIEMSSVLSAQTLMTVFELSAVLTAVRMRRSPDPLRWAMATGLFTGLAALTHASAIVLIVPLGVAASSVVPVVGRRQVAGLLVLIASTLLTLSPWLIRDGLVMHRFVPITDASGITLSGTYNPTSAHARPPYGWVYYRQVPADAGIAARASRLSETQLSSRLDGRALSYVAHHPAAVLGAGWHNTLRLAELDGSAAWHQSAQAIGLTRATADIGMICFWGLGVLALLGLVAPLGLRAPGWLWGVPVAMWLVTVPVNAQTPSFRSAIDPFLILLGARGIARVARWMRRRPAAVARSRVAV